MIDYKRIIKNRNLRIRILQVMSFVPDKLMIKLQYRIKTGRKLNLDNPQRYTEKLQWYKLYYRDPLMKKCADKYDVREYVEKCGYKEILNSVYGVYENVENIDFDSLPDQYVVKSTLGGGGNEVFICTNKQDVDKKQLKLQMIQWIKPVKGKNPGREWVYDEGRNKIIIEKYLEGDVSKGGLIDYKFFCFDGKVTYVYGIADRVLGQGGGIGIYNRDFELLPYRRKGEPLNRAIEKPFNYDEMVKCAEDLSRPFPHARIDLYNQEGKIVFGEITFFNGSGYVEFEPDEFDYILGKEFYVGKIWGGVKLQQYIQLLKYIRCNNASLEWGCVVA